MKNLGKLVLLVVCVFLGAAVVILLLVNNTFGIADLVDHIGQQPTVVVAKTSTPKIGGGLLIPVRQCLEPDGTVVAFGQDACASNHLQRSTGRTASVFYNAGQTVCEWRSGRGNWYGSMLVVLADDGQVNGYWCFVHQSDSRVNFVSTRPTAQVQFGNFWLVLNGSQVFGLEGVERYKMAMAAKSSDSIPRTPAPSRSKLKTFVLRPDLVRNRTETASQTQLAPVVGEGSVDDGAEDSSEPVLPTATPTSMLVPTKTPAIMPTPVNTGVPSLRPTKRP